LAVAPALTNVVTFALGPTGTLISSSVTASSLSADADTSVLAAIAGAAANHAFPPIPATMPPRQSLPFDVMLTTTAPNAVQGAVVVDQIALPEWRLTRSTVLAPGNQPLWSAPRSATQPADSATLEFVVDESGKAIIETARAIGRASQASDAAHQGFVARIARLLPAFRFDPALVGACPVRQLTTQVFAD
jgi:hypothetical protein